MQALQFFLPSFFQTTPLPYSLDTWKAHLTSSTPETWRFHGALKGHVTSASDETLNTFITSLIEKGIETEQLEKALDFLTHLLDLKKLQQAVKTATQNVCADPVSWAKEKLDLEESSETPLKQGRKFCRFSVPLISDLIDTFLSAVEALDGSQKHTSIWEKYLILEILYKFFLTPFQLAKFLEPWLLTPLKVYGSVGLFFSIGLFSINFYKKHLKPLPSKILYLERMEIPLTPAPIRDLAAWGELCQALKKEGARPFLIGKSGSGKSSLINGLIYEQRLEKSPLKRFTFLAVNLSQAKIDHSFGYGAILDEIAKQIEGHEEEIVLVVDEAQNLVEGGLLNTFKEKILRKMPKVRCLFAATTMHYQQYFVDPDTDGSVRSTLFPIHVVDTDDAVNIRIFQQYVRLHCQGIHVQEESYGKLLELAKKIDYLKNVGIPRKGKNILDQAIRVCEAALSAEYEHPDLRAKQAELRNLTRSIHSSALTTEAVLQQKLTDKENLKKNIEALKQTTHTHRDRACKLQKITALRSRMQKMSGCLAAQVVRFQKPREIKRFLLTDIYAAPILLKKTTKASTSEEGGAQEFCITPAMIETCYQKLKEATPSEATT